MPFEARMELIAGVEQAATFDDLSPDVQALILKAETCEDTGVPWGTAPAVTPVEQTDAMLAALKASLGVTAAIDPANVANPDFEAKHPRDHGKFTEKGGGAAEDRHAVGVSSNPQSDSLITKVTRRDGESDQAFNERVFQQGLEHYPPATALETAAASYRAEHGLPEPKVTDWTGIEAPWERALVVSATFDALHSDPSDPTVKAAYHELVAQTNDQWNLLTGSPEQGGMGIKVDFVTPDDIKARYGDDEGLNPYKSAAAQRDDLVNNHHLAIASLGPFPEAYHPLLDSTLGGEYDRMRAVHDAFGHAAIGADFTRHGEFEAWTHHVSMFYGSARQAATTELHGENSFLVSHGGVPAVHKAALMPDRFVNPWDRLGNLNVDAWKSQAAAARSAALDSEVRYVGGDPDVVAWFGVVNSANVLHAVSMRKAKAAAEAGAALHAKAQAITSK